MDASVALVCSFAAALWAGAREQGHAAAAGLLLYSQWGGRPESQRLVHKWAQLAQYMTAGETEPRSSWISKMLKLCGSQ